MLNKPYFNIGSLWTPKLDGSEALYIPFWHPTYGSNPASYISKDRSAKSWARTGGVWGYQGWTADGDDYFSVAEYLNFGTGGFSVSAWVKITASAVIKTIIGNDNGASPYYHLRIAASTGYGNFYFRDAEGQAVSCTGNTDLTGAWHFITGVRLTSDPTTGVLFVDGVQQATTTTANANGSINSGGRDEIGCDYNAGTRRSFFVGTIGEVIIHKALSLSLADHTRLMQRSQWRYKN